MASAPFIGTWSPAAQFAGNAAFVYSGGTIWLIGNSVADVGVSLYRSTDLGATFTSVVTVPNVASTSVAFDPALAIDANGVLHFVGQVASGSSISLQKYSYNPATTALTGPATLATGALAPSDYDIVALSNGHTYVVTAWLTGMTETVEGWELDATGAVVETDSWLSQSLRGGSRYGSVSLWTPDGAAVEIYLSSMSKALLFSDALLTISQLTRTSGGGPVPQTPVTLTTMEARYAADLLTVIGNGSVRYLCQTAYTQSGGNLGTATILGYYDGTNWYFNSFPGLGSGGALALSSSGLVLGVVEGLTSVGGGTISLYNVTLPNWQLTRRTDFPYPGLATLLRGSKSLLPTTLPWGFVSERAADGVGRFYTGASLPPVAQIQPTTIAGVRGQTYTFSAASSSDLNDDSMEFAWALTDPTGHAVLTQNGASATVTLPASAGPAAASLTLIVTVTAVDAPGNTVATPGTASTTLTYPAVAAPTIATPSTLAAARNANVTLTPQVTVSPYGTASYIWTQTAGTHVSMLTPSSAEVLEVATNGAAVAGETLTFLLTVSDGINTPVSQAFQITVAARQATGETQRLSRATWAGNISQRNDSLAWTSPVAGSAVTEFVAAKRAALYPSGTPGYAGQSGSYLLIGPHSVTIERHGEIWRVLTPDPAVTIVDAVHAFLDETLVLTSDHKLMRFVPSSPAVDTDNPADTILLDSILPETWTSLQVTPPYVGGSRVATVIGPGGVLFLQLNAEFAIEETLALTASTGGLYGGANVQWIRLSNVEDLHSGTVLIGTTDGAATPSFYETEYSLATRSVVGVWDSTMLRNQTVAAGELLFASTDSWCGIPQPPILLAPLSVEGGVLLSWTQERSDLVVSYDLMVSTGGSFTPLAEINSGNVWSIVVSLAAGHSYSFQMTASSVDGASNISNTVTISL